MTIPRSNLPPELQNVATSEDLNTLENKMLNCYSKDRYKEFQDEVETIVLKKLKTDDAHSALNEHVDGRVAKVLSKRGWKNANFWIPTVIGSLGIIVALVAIFLKK